MPTQPETLVIGATAWSAGLALAGRDVLIVERGAGVGAEYFDCFRAGASEVGGVAGEWRAESSLRGGLADFLAPSPLLYERLKPHAARFRLWTEVVSVVRRDNRWQVEIADAAGSHTLSCTRLVDSSPACRSNPAFARENVTSRLYTAAVLAAAPLAAEMIGQNGRDGWTVEPGRTPDEILLRRPYSGDGSAHAARRSLLAAWRARPPAWKDARIAALAKASTCAVRRQQARLGPDYVYFNGAQFPDAFAAVAAGTAADALSRAFSA